MNECHDEGVRFYLTGESPSILYCSIRVCDGGYWTDRVVGCCAMGIIIKLTGRNNKYMREESSWCCVSKNNNANTVPCIIPDIAINSMVGDSDDETMVILLLMLRPMMLCWCWCQWYCCLMPVLFAFVLVAFSRVIDLRKWFEREDGK